MNTKTQAYAAAKLEAMLHSCLDRLDSGVTDLELEQSRFVVMLRYYSRVLKPSPELGALIENVNQELGL